MVARLLCATIVAALLAPGALLAPPATYALSLATTTVTSSAPSALAGSAVTFTVRVSDPAGTPVPTGTVALYDGATQIGGCTLASGACTVVSGALSVGAHAISAAYSGDAAHDPGTSAVTIQTITAGIRAARTAATTNSSGQTSLAVAAPVGATTGDVIVAALAVSGSGTTITASGWTKLTGSDLTAGTLLRQGLYYRVRAATDPSTFTFTFSSAQKASVVMVAVAGASAGVVPQSAGLGYTSATAFTLPSLTFAARASGVAFGFLGVAIGTTLSSVANGYTSAGSIAATGGKAATQTTSAAGQLALADASGATGARITMAAAAVGVGHSVFVPTSPAATVTRILTGPTAATFGTAGSWSVRVDPTTATGSVAFLVDGAANGVGCASLVAGACSTSFPLAAGLHTVAARFTPTPTSLLASTSANATISVARATSSTSIAALAPTTTRGAAATFRISVSGGGNASPGTGTVRVVEGATDVASCTLVNGACDATTATLAIGSHTLFAAFDGDTNLEASASGTVVQTVTRAPSTTTLALSASSSPLGSALTLTATVSGGGGAPTGTVDFSDGTLPLTSCVLGSGGVAGACSVVVRSLSIGAHGLVARYGGDPDRLESSSGTQTVTIVKATSTLAVSSTPASPTLGTAVTLRASVTTGDGSVPTGTVTFTEGTTVLGSCGLGTGASPVAGACTISVAGFTVGDHAVGVAYAGDTLHQTTSTTFTQTIGRAPTTTSIATSSATSSYASPVTFTVTVTSGAGTPTGSATIYDGVTPLTTCSLSSGTCAYTTAALSVGNHTIAVTYLGDANRAQSSASVLQSVTRAVTSTTLTVGGTLTFGAAATLTAVVDRTAATGTVAFTDGSTPLGTCTLGSGGTPGRCTLTTSALAAGTRSIVATYVGDANYAASGSVAATPTIGRAATALSLAKAGGSTYGTELTFTATLDRTAATGLVTFTDAGVTIGTCTIGTLAPGSCALVTNSLAVGSHSVVASYGGDTSYLPATSSSVSASIVRGASTTTIAASASGVLIGDSVTFSVAVSPSTATGLVDVLDGASWLGQCQLSGGTCTVTTSFATRGARSIVAGYQGDTNVAPSTSTVVAVLVQSATTTTLVTDVASSTYGGAVTLTAFVSGADGGTPTGRVAFSDGTTGIGACDLAGGASCSITLTTIPAGTRSLVARYGGDQGYAASNGTVSLPVVEATSATTVTASAASAPALTPITFTVIVATADGSVATGSVAVSDGTTPISTCRLSVGACTVTTDQLATGARTINATFLGDPNHTGSTSAVAVTITALATTVTATANPTSATWGSSVTLTATVSPSAATGSVTFSEAGTTYGSCSILAASPGTCSITTSAMAVGNRTVTVRYGGDTKYATSSTTVAVTIAKAPTTTTVASSAATTTYATAVTLTATVSPNAATGTISFSDGTAGIGTCTLAAGSNGTCSITTSALSVGSHAITARYAGSTNLRESTSGTLTQTVNPAPTQLTFGSAVNPSIPGAGTATISISPSAAGGSVAITDNGNPFTTCTLASGTCTISLASLALGTHTLVASYPGTTNYGASTGQLTQVVSIGYRAFATATSGSKTVASLGVTVPASVTSGDVLVAAVTITGTTTITPASGWTRLGIDVTSGAVTQGLFWKAATSGDVGVAASFGFSTSVKAEIVLIAVGGATTNGPAAFASQLNPAATSISTPMLSLASSTRGMALIFGGIAGATTVASVGSGFVFPAGAETATNGGQAQTTTAAAYSTPNSYASIGGSSIATNLTGTGAVSIGHVVFIPQAP